jgi:hypothetical protein
MNQDSGIIVEVEGITSYVIPSIDNQNVRILLRRKPLSEDASCKTRTHN